MEVLNGWQPFSRRNQGNANQGNANQGNANQGNANRETEPGTYYIKLEAARCPNTAAQDETATKLWENDDITAFTESDISQLTTLQLVTHSRTEKTDNDALAGSGSWFQLSILNGDGDDIKKLPNGQSLTWLSHSNWFRSNQNEWCRGRMFTKDDEIFKHLKPNSTISVWMSAGPKHRNHADQAYLVFGFGSGPGTYRTPKLEPRQGDQPPVISVHAQERKECLVMPEDGSSSEIKANIVDGGINLIDRLLDRSGNDWTVNCHSIGQLNEPGAGAPVRPNFDSFIELASGKKDAIPPIRVVRQSTVDRSRDNSDITMQGEAKIVIWDDFGVKDGTVNDANPPSRILIYQMHAPLWTGALWDGFLARAEPNNNNNLSAIVVIDADDLRADGIRISRGISWEKTMEDFKAKMGKIYDKMVEGSVDAIQRKARLNTIHKNVHLLVRCGYEGVLHVRPSPDNSPHPFIFHMVPNMAEGELLRPYKGRMSGIYLAFLAGLSASLARQPLTDQRIGRTQIGLAIELAIVWSNRFASTGFYKDGNRGFHYPKAEDVNHYRTPKVKVIYGDRSMIKDNGRWSLFSLLEQTRNSVAAEVVKLGTDRLVVSVPTAKYGAVQTADRTEIEGYRSTAAVIHEYLSGKSKKPLSLAVFGQPGAGKSFGVKEVIKAVLQDWGYEKCDPIEANLSQFMEYSDLVRVFDKVRDKTLKGDMPVVLFDEFDSSFGTQPLGWLKYFLAPMQDAEFLDCGSIRPLGRAIFVFIGGTSSTFKNFSKGIDEDAANGGDHNNNNNAGHNGDGQNAARQDRLAKKPDFVSRLSAHINVRGPNQADDRDKMFVMRRAILLQSQLERHFGAKVKDIVVDKTVLNAMLKHENFPKGTRSIELILQTSKLSGLRRFEPSALPSDDQLSMHVGKAKAFHALIDNEPIVLEPVRPVDIDMYNKLMWAKMERDHD